MDTYSREPGRYRYYTVYSNVRFITETDNVLLNSPLHIMSQWDMLPYLAED